MKKRTVHLVGIGGIGVSSLAQWFKSQGWSVSGSDGTRSEVTDGAKKAGIRVSIGANAANVPGGAELVIMSQAIPKGHPERKEAERRGIRSLTYPQMIGELTRSYETAAVSGAHGKSTTTALLSLIAAAAKLDPTVIVGTRLREFGGTNFRAGKSKLLILEADEYGRAFHEYSPLWAATTNIDAEHLEIYGSLAGVKKAFLKFYANVRPGGTLVLNADDKNLASLSPAIAKIARKNGLSAVWYSAKDPIAAKLKRILRIPGAHNVSNALAALHLARMLGVKDAVSLAALARYTGSWRRMEFRGKYKGALVYDDYGHHPTEIKATLQAFREKYPQKKIVCVFEPHQAERLRRLFKEFQTAFEGADQALLLPEYRVAGRDTADPRFSSEALVRSIQKREPKKPVFYLSSPENLPKALDALGTKHAVVIMMGAGRIADFTKLLV